MNALTLRRAAAWVLLVSCACTVTPVPYREEINDWRAAKDRFMREAADSPVLPGERAAFQPLVYFPVEEAYRIPAELRVIRGEDVMQMTTSDGKVREMRRIGTLAFTLKGQAQTLTAFVESATVDMRRLFVPFGDLTNGTETYTGGRYLDLDRTATGIYDLDFNRAYFPFCYYNPAFICPIPPKENRLQVPVRAGERNGKKG